MRVTCAIFSCLFFASHASYYYAAVGLIVSVVVVTVAVVVVSLGVKPATRCERTHT